MQITRKAADNGRQRAPESQAGKAADPARALPPGVLGSGEGGGIDQHNPDQVIIALINALLLCEKILWE